MKMDIGNIGKQTYSYCKTTKQTATRNNKLFSAADQKADVEETLRYYRELCSEFPEVSFRLDDEEEMVKAGVGNCSLGYNGSMNQIGENYGNPSQYSIRLDVSVIRKMQKDPEYARNIKGEIGTIKYNYSVLMNDSAAPYGDVCLVEKNGSLEISIGRSRMPYSTEKEIRQMWGKKDKSEKYFEKKIMQVQNELQEAYMKMTEKPHRPLKREKVEEQASC